MSPAVRVIESRQNPHYKQWQHYITHPEERACPWIAVEGWKQVRDLAEPRGIELLLFSTPDDPRLESLLPFSQDAVRLTSPLLKRLSDLDTPQGVIAFLRKPCWEWDQLARRVLYLYRLQDPGNLGTMFRTVAASGMFSLVTSPETVSCFNAKAVRATAGSLFSTPFLEGIEPQELADRGYPLWAASPREGISLFDVDFEAPMAIVIGNEGSGLEAAILKRVQGRISIPMQPGAESLNAAVAGSLIVYEAFRRQDGHG